MHPRTCTFDPFLEKNFSFQFHVCPCYGLNDFLFHNLTFHPSCPALIQSQSGPLLWKHAMHHSNQLFYGHGNMLLWAPIKTAQVTILVILNWQNMVFTKFTVQWDKYGNTIISFNVFQYSEWFLGFNFNFVVKFKAKIVFFVSLWRGSERQKQEAGTRPISFIKHRKN